MDFERFISNLQNLEQDYFYSLILLIGSFLFLVYFKNKFSALLYKIFKKNDSINFDKSKILPTFSIVLLSIFISLLPIRDRLDYSIGKYIETGILVIVIFQIIQLFSYFYRIFIISRLKVIDDKESKNIYQYLSNTFLVVIWVLAFVFLLSNMGIDVSTFVAGLGITGFAIAFGIRKIIFDLISSIVLILDKPFLVGDRIKISDSIEGVVQKIGLRSIKLQGSENQLIIIPNSEIVSKAITNFQDKNFQRINLEIELTLQDEPSINEVKILQKNLKENLDYIDNFEIFTKEIKPDAKIIEVCFKLANQDIEKDQLMVELLEILNKYNLKFNYIKLL
ncbi:MAG: hypothetical protein KatS3mg085_655 [Candidatus Dojkabacteria bacterium]|nr:MAG: hypothetical protein KatS3mg085_655 [Candidatus Dojkabacteria bacterium]